MNFKRFGLGKQLINLSVATYGKYIDANGVEQTSASGLANHTDYISVTANRLYTVSYSKPNVSGNTIAISWYDSNKIFIKRDSETMPFELGRYKFTKTAPNNSAFAIVNFTYFSAYTETQNTHNYIFAIGESQLPYEPYGNTWTDIPYYIMGTSTDTITTPADIYVNDTTATVGLKGNMSQTGTPTNQNPIQPSETGDRTGNLFDKDNTTIYNAYFAIDSESSIWITNADSRSVKIPCKPNTQYTLSISSAIPIFRICSSSNANIVPSSGGVRVRTIIRSENIQQYTFTTSADDVCILFQGSASMVNEWFNSLMLNEGSTAIPYQPYGYKIPISSASTTTPVYLGEVETTRKIKKLVLSSSQNWKLQSINSHGIANFYIAITNNFLNNSSVISNYFALQTTTIADTTTEGMLIALTTNSATVYIRFNSQTASTAQEFKNWLDGLSEEAAIWYVLAEPTTGIVNEPIRKIGDYADTVSGISIPTIIGKDTFDVLTTLKPSEVTVNYHGWHPVQSVHEKSAQMFDKDNADLYEGTSLSVANKWYYAGGQATIIRIPCEVSTLYTLKITASNTVFRISTVATDDVPSEGNDVVATTIVNSGEITEYTFTTPSDAKYILFQGSYAVLSTILNTLMLNEGSSALPYEPYWT